MDNFDKYTLKAAELTGAMALRDEARQALNRAQKEETRASGAPGVFRNQVLGNRGREESLNVAERRTLDQLCAEAATAKDALHAAQDKFTAAQKRVDEVKAERRAANQQPVTAQQLRAAMSAYEDVIARLDKLKANIAHQEMELREIESSPDEVRELREKRQGIAAAVINGDLNATELSAINTEIQEAERHREQSIARRDLVLDALEGLRQQFNELERDRANAQEKKQFMLKGFCFTRANELAPDCMEALRKAASTYQEMIGFLRIAGLEAPRLNLKVPYIDGVAGFTGGQIGAAAIDVSAQLQDICGSSPAGDCG